MTLSVPVQGKWISWYQAYLVVAGAYPFCRWRVASLSRIAVLSSRVNRFIASPLSFDRHGHR
jgi:hypothetical protein